eukprot:jgi/Bigna1/145177/aug1.96_g19885
MAATTGRSGAGGGGGGEAPLQKAADDELVFVDEEVEEEERRRAAQMKMIDEQKQQALDGRRGRAEGQGRGKGSTPNEDVDDEATSNQRELAQLAETRRLKSLGGFMYRGKLFMGEKGKVCFDWLNGICERGEACPMLHKFDLENMPSCPIETRKHPCSKEGCIFVHKRWEGKPARTEQEDALFYGGGDFAQDERRILEEEGAKNAPCPYFFLGYCPLGDACTMRHKYHPIPFPPPKRMYEWVFKGKLPSSYRR